MCTRCARVLLESGDAGGALELIRGAIDGLGGRDGALARAWLDRGMVEVALQQPMAARASVNLAERFARTSGLFGLEPEVALARAQVADLEGDIEGAWSALAESVRALEAVGGSLPSDRLRASLLRTRGDLFRWGLGLACRRGRDASLAFEMMERPLARSMLDQLVASAGEDGRSAPASEALIGVRGELSATLSLLEMEAAAETPSKRLAETRQCVERLEREALQLESRIQASAACSGLAVEPPSIDCVAGALPGDTMVLAFGRTPDGYARLALTRHGRRLDTLDVSPADMHDVLRRFSSEVDRALARRSASSPMGSSLVDRADALLDALGTGLLAGLNGDLRAHRRLVIAPGAGLERAPFAALRVGGSALAEGFEVRLAPSVTVAMALAGRAAPEAGGTVLVGVPDARAPRVASEVGAIGGLVGSGARRLVGEAASSSRVASAVMGAGVVHLACHGRFSAESAMESGLRLADGWAAARSVARWPLTGATVVLSGCETGCSDGSFGGGIVRVDPCGAAGRCTAGDRELVAYG